MLRRSLTGLVFVMPLAFLVVDSPVVKSQGIFRRIRDRVQERALQVPPQYRPPAQQRGPRPQIPQRPTQAPNPGSRSRVQLQRIAPVRPGGPTLAAPNARQRTAQPGNTSRTFTPKGTPQAKPYSPAINSKDFGRSILSAPQADSPVVRPAAKPPVPGTSSRPRNLNITPLPALELTPAATPVLKPTTEPVPGQRFPQSSRSVGEATLGIEVLESNVGVRGLKVVRFQAGSKCEAAGLRVGDVIVTVNGKSTPTVADIARLTSSNVGGDVIRARIVRGHQTTALSLPLIDRNAGSTPASTSPATTHPALPEPQRQGAVDLGLSVEPQRGVRGVIVRAVAVGSPAAAAGLKEGDRVVAIDGKILATLTSFEQEISSHQVGEQVAFQMIRDGKLVSTDVNFSPPSLENGTGKTALTTDANATTSVLSGLGSALGGLLGGGQASTEKPAAAAQELIDDEMAFGDDEVVLPVGYESELQRKLKALEADPPSLKNFEELPVGNTVDPVTVAPDPHADERNEVETLRAEIHRLNERLEKIEAANKD